jgi:hypothetical protein
MPCAHPHVHMYERTIDHKEEQTNTYARTQTHTCAHLAIEHVVCLVDGKDT